MTGRTFELAAGFYSEIRWERSRGSCQISLANILQTKIITGANWRTGDETFTPSAVAAKWAEVQNFDNPEYPANSEDGDIPVGSMHPLFREPIDLLAGHLAAVQITSPKQANLPANRFQGKDRHHHRCWSGARQDLRIDVREARRERCSERRERGRSG